MAIGLTLGHARLAVTLVPNFVVFLIGSALFDIAIGGFWSLSTAILARLASGPDLPKAIALLQGGSAFAIVIAAPLGRFFGEPIGWRGMVPVTVPIGLAALVWQLPVLPKIPAMETVSVTRTVRLLRALLRGVQLEPCFRGDRRATGALAHS